MTTTRRRFLATLPMAALAPRVASAAGVDAPGPVTFGFITDVHHGTHGNQQVARLRRFIDAAIERSPDFIIQCGDFCCARGGLAACSGLLAEWNRFPGPKHHVIGNHDCDFQTKEELLAAWRIPHRHYSFDAGPFHFVVLDRNHFLDEDDRAVPYANGNWYHIHRRGGPGHLSRVSCTDTAQLEWLAADLAATGRPVIVFQHQPSGVGSHEGNWAELNEVIDRHNAGRRRVQVAAVLCGHDHDEQLAVRHGVHHLTLTSSTFGLPFGGNTAYYDPARPPFTFVTLDPAAATMTIEAADSSYLAEPPIDPALAWIDPPRIAARTIPLGSAAPS